MRRSGIGRQYILCLTRCCFRDADRRKGATGASLDGIEILTKIRNSEPIWVSTANTQGGSVAIREYIHDRACHHDDMLALLGSKKRLAVSAAPAEVDSRCICSKNIANLKRRRIQKTMWKCGRNVESEMVMRTEGGVEHGDTSGPSSTRLLFVC